MTPKASFRAGIFFSMLALMASCAENKSVDAPEASAPPKDSIVPAAATALYIDVHELGAGKVDFEAVKGAHEKDLATQGKYNVNFIKYWVDEREGKVYCLSKASDTGSITQTHRDAHGLLPSSIFQVSEGMEVALTGEKNLYLDIHELGAGKVTAKEVAGAHEKDLAAQGKHGVNFINYWVDEKKGTVMCLSEAPDSNAVIQTHKDAHGLLPNSIQKVKQGQ